MKKHYDEKYSDVEGTKKLYGNRKLLEIDDYAIDMHTSLGRRLKKNKADVLYRGHWWLTKIRNFMWKNGRL